MEFKGLTGIDEYLSSKGNYYPIDVSELDNISEAIMAYTGLNKEQSKRILTLLFQEIRTVMLSGQIVDIRGFGSFYISSPAVSSNSKKIFPKFKSKQSLLKRLNHE